MALDLSKLNFFSRLSARSRMLVLVSGIILVLFIIYLGARWIAGDSGTVGSSRVASAPQGLQSVPGGQLTPEYYQALAQANQQSAQQAQVSGTSAVPTLINTAGMSGSANCIICLDQSANIKVLLDDWQRQGKITAELATELGELGDKNTYLNDFGLRLEQLLKDGKLQPDQARDLLETYRKQYANVLLQESAKFMDDLIKRNQLPLLNANELLTAQKEVISNSGYAALIKKMIDDHSFSANTGSELLAQYTKQRGRQIILFSISELKKMRLQGEITQEIEKELIALENDMPPIATFAAVLDKDVADGKLTPAVSEKILDEYKWQKSQIGLGNSTYQLIQDAEAAAYQEISELLRDHLISSDTADILRGMIRRNVSQADFEATIAQLVQQNKLTPEIAKLKIADYLLISKYRDLSQRLEGLQSNNASVAEFGDELKRNVASGLLTAEQAAALMRQYDAGTSKEENVEIVSGKGTEAFAALQKRVLVEKPAAPLPDFNVPPAVVQPVEDPNRDERIAALVSSMSSQATQLVQAWQPIPMLSKQGNAEVEKKGTTPAELTPANGAGGNKAGQPGTPIGTIPFIKAGTILFAVLDTEVNSDYPDTPVMATVVAGKYKGAKLLGKLTTAKSAVGQLDRVSLNFSLMNLEEWVSSKTITAFAIDPDKARTALASNVDYHYMQRFGAIMATSFLQGYSNAITSSGSTSTPSVFGTTTTTSTISPANKIAVGLGQIGQTLGNTTQNWVNRAPTVKVDSGVGLGILFMADVT